MPVYDVKVTEEERSEFKGSVVLAKYLEQREAERLSARRMKGSLRRFDAAVYNRLTHSWQAAERSINTELRGDLDALRRRSRDLAKNSPLARKFLKMCVTNIAGPRGFTLQARAADGGKADDMANKAVEAAWADWGRARHCDVAGRLSFRSMTKAVVLAVARDGEALIRIREGAKNPYGYALQLLDIERLDTTLNREMAPGMNQIIMGVEMDGAGKPVAYHLLVVPFGRDTAAKRHVRILAAEIIHLFMAEDPEQVRGVPWMHAAMLAVNDLKGYNHAAIVAARIGASKMGFFVLPDGNTNNAGDGEDEQGAPFISAEPGQFGVIRGEGADFKSFDPDYPHANYASFVKEHKRDIATGWGVAYNSLANDLEGVNFSSIRSGTLEERDNWMLAQADFIELFCDVVYEGWLDNALLSGAILLPNGSALPAAKMQKFMAHEFQGRRWQWVDPLKDIEAAVLAIENGLASPYSIAAQQGVDAEDVLDDIARFMAAAKARGIELGKKEAPPAKTAPDKPDDGVADKALRALLLRAAEAPAAQPPNVNVHAPITIHNPEQRHEITVQPAPAPEVRVAVAAPNVTIEPAAVEVQLEARMPDQPAPVVNITVETPDELKIVSLPTRVTTTEIERGKDGAIQSSRQVEKDAA